MGETPVSDTGTRPSQTRRIGQVVFVHGAVRAPAVGAAVVTLLLR